METNLDQLLPEAFPVGYVIPEILDDHRYDSNNKRLVAEGQRKGLKAVEEEKAVVQLNNRLGVNKNQVAAQVVSEGNKIAQDKDRFASMGQAASEEQIDCSPTKTPDRITEQSIARGSYGSGGYEVSEYKPSDYSMTCDYSISDYKSVYDA